MRSLALLAFLCLPVAGPVSSQTAPPPPATEAAKPSQDYSGMYSFLREGEFLQLSIEEDGRVTGFISRFGDSESDRGTFLNQFFKKASLEGKKLYFTTEIVHGVWFEFNGTVGRGSGKTHAEEGYFVLRGSLVQNQGDAAKKTTSQTRDVTFRSFPEDADQPTPPQHD